MRKHLMLLFSILGMALYSGASTAVNEEQPVIPCDQPGANPGGTTAMDSTTAPCNVGTPNDVGNTSVTGPEDAKQNRLPPRSETKQLPPPQNPDPQPAPRDR